MTEKSWVSVLDPTNNIAKSRIHAQKERTNLRTYQKERSTFTTSPSKNQRKITSKGKSNQNIENQKEIRWFKPELLHLSKFHSKSKLIFEGSSNPWIPDRKNRKNRWNCKRRIVQKGREN